MTLEFAKQEAQRGANTMRRNYVIFRTYRTQDRHDGWMVAPLASIPLFAIHTQMVAPKS